jgi:hypothetical protein
MCSLWSFFMITLSIDITNYIEENQRHWSWMNLNLVRYKHLSLYFQNFCHSIVLLTDSESPARTCAIWSCTFNIVIVIQEQPYLKLNMDINFGKSKPYFWYTINGLERERNFNEKHIIILKKKFKKIKYKS